MPQVLKRPQAETDLDEIWWYIAQDNPDNADRFLDLIEERCQALAQFPHLGVSSRRACARIAKSLGWQLSDFLPAH
jgi:toxin ParE1/3/4